MRRVPYVLSSISTLNNFIEREKKEKKEKKNLNSKSTKFDVTCTGKSIGEGGGAYMCDATY